MRLSAIPGLYELVETGDGTAATLVAAMIAKEAGHALWVSSPDAYAPALYAAVQLSVSAGYQCARVSVALDAIKVAESLEACNLAVVDNLAGLHGDHPGARTIAADVKRAIMGWSPRIPVLVVNNWREPAPPGGVYWRGRANARTLDVLRQEPLIAHLADFQEGCPPLFLVWYPNYRPELRPLKSVEWRYFFPDGIPGWGVHFQSGRPATVTPTGQRPSLRPWLIERRASHV